MSAPSPTADWSWLIGIVATSDASLISIGYLAYFTSTNLSTTNLLRLRLGSALWLGSIGSGLQRQTQGFQCATILLYISDAFTSEFLTVTCMWVSKLFVYLMAIARWRNKVVETILLILKLSNTRSPYEMAVIQDAQADVGSDFELR